MTKNTDVLIIGGGPSGMISALCLAKLGIASIIVERNALISEHPKAHELNTRSIEILKELGISSEVLQKEAAPFSDGARILFCNTINEEFGRIDLYADTARRQKYEQYLQSKTPYLNISQTALEKIILQKIQSNPLIKILFYHQWQSLTKTTKGIDNEILERQSATTFTIQSRFVIAADGAGSRCRQFLDIAMEGPEKIQEFASAYFETNLRDFIKTPAKLYWILNPFAAGTFIAHHIEKRWVYMVPIYLDYQQKEQFDKSFFENRIKTALGDLSLDIQVKSISFWRMSAQLAQTYRKGKVVLVGDAAHRFPPTGGLGMNTGIADAHNICWKLQTVLKGEAPLDFLDTYEWERKPIAAQNTEESVYNFHKIMEVPATFGLEVDGLEKMAKFRAVAPTKWLPEIWKDKLLHFATAMAAKSLQKFHKNSELRAKVQSVIADQVAHFDRIGLDIGYVYEEGAIIPDGSAPIIPEDKVMDYIPSTRPGARFPHIDLSTSGQFQSTHDLLDYQRFTLIIREKGEIWNKAYQEFVIKHPEKLQLVELHQLNLPPADYTNLINLCAIEETGALLIRPDGHIAWRKQKLETQVAVSLLPIFEQLYQHKTAITT